MTAHVITCCGVDYDLALLPHFVKHYAARGADVFHVILHTNVEDVLAIQDARDALNDSGAMFSIEEWQGEFTAGKKRWRMSREIKRHGKPGDVFCMVDVDEFAEVDDIQSTFDAYDSPVVYGRLIDRFAASGPGTLGAVQESPSIFTQFPISNRKFSAKHCGMKSPYKAVLQGFGAYTGIHNFRGNEFSAGIKYKNWCKQGHTPIKIHHFKWTEGRIEKSTARMKMQKRKGKPTWRNSKRVLKAIR